MSQTVMVYLIVEKKTAKVLTYTEDRWTSGKLAKGMNAVARRASIVISNGIALLPEKFVALT